jgi:hypothetical protein
MGPLLLRAATVRRGARGHSPHWGRSAGTAAGVTPNPANRPLWCTKVPILQRIEALSRPCEAACSAEVPSRRSSVRPTPNPKPPTAPASANSPPSSTASSAPRRICNRQRPAARVVSRCAPAPRPRPPTSAMSSRTATRPPTRPSSTPSSTRSASSPPARSARLLFARGSTTVRISALPATSGPQLTRQPPRPVRSASRCANRTGLCHRTPTGSPSWSSSMIVARKICPGSPDAGALCTPRRHHRSADVTLRS